MGAVLTPDVGSPILPTDPVVFDLTDATETLTSILITVRHDSGLIELAHDGTSFTSFYASGSTRTVITDGYRYSLIRAGGWADTKVVVSAFPFAGTGAGLINFSSDFGVLSDPPGEDVALSVTGVSAGTYGNSSHVGQFTTDSKGRLTAAASVTIILANNSGTTITNVGTGGTTATNAAIISDVDSRVATEAAARAAADATITTNLGNEITNRIAGDLNAINVSETFTLAQIAAIAFGVTNAAALIAIDTTTLSSGVWRWVATYKAWFYLDKISGLTADPHRVLAATTGGGFWVRDESSGSPFWQAQTVWYIDPAGTNSTPGNDEADGLSSSTPIKSIAEWRRRVKGVVYSGNGPVINALSGSTNADDGIFSGFVTIGTLTNVRVLGRPVTTGVSGTVASYVAYSGNTRGQFSDSSIPASWTASGAVSSPAGSRWARKIGSGVRHYAPLDKDLGSKTVQFGHVVDWDETDPVTVRTTETNFANGDAYEAVSLPIWPVPSAASGAVTFQCFDFQGFGSPVFADSTSYGGLLNYRLCGFPNNYGFLEGTRTVIYSCVFCALSPAGVNVASNALFMTNCSAVNTILELSFAGFALSTTSLILVNSEFRLFHAAIGGTLGNMRFFDCTAPLISVRHDSTAKCTAAVVGSGNTGPLVNCDSFGVLAGASFITAATSKANPYTVNGVDFATPVVDGGSGDGIYN